MNFEEIKKLNTTEYKKYHEALMQNNHGTSAVHVFFCIFFTVQCSMYASLRLQYVTRFKCFYEYIIIVLPLILTHTILADYMYILNVIIGVLLLFEVKPYLIHITELKHHFKKKRIASISILRGLTYLITVFAILAVDFQSFPRNLAKTEKYGFSLMDTGVGLFVLMSGLVHKDLRKHKLINILKSNLKFICVLFFLGVARYVSVKQLDYQEHVSEYGVHWNFFFTLAICKLLSTLLLYFIPCTFECSFILLAIHEIILGCGVRKWVFSDAARDDFLSANREGVSSCLGYVSLYIFAAHMKKKMSEPSVLLRKSIFKSPNIYIDTVQVELTILPIFLWILLILLHYVIPASRTLANASYCLFLESVLVTVISILYNVEKIYEDDRNVFPMSEILDNINKNGLVYFLVSNLLTGGLNLCMRTLTMSSSITFVILNCYMIITLGLVSFLSMKRKKTKDVT